MSSSNSIKKILENIVEGFFSKKSNINPEKFTIKTDDPIDVVFAKKINNTGGRFFYCKNKDGIQPVLKRLINYLNIKRLYCLEPTMQEILNDLNINFEPKNETNCDAMITTCEHIIADQGKVLLSSKQIQNKNIKTLPNELIVLSYTSNIVLRINDAMRSITKKYKTKIPSNITTVGNTKKEEATIENNKKLNVIIIEDFKS